MIIPNKFKIGNSSFTQKDILIVMIASATSSVSSVILIDLINDFEMLPFPLGIIFAMLFSLILIWMLLFVLLYYLQFLYCKKKRRGTK